jgi:hypothetical protein
VWWVNASSPPQHNQDTIEVTPKLKDPNAWFKQVVKVNEDPAASGWLKNTLIEAINRDPVSAAEDAEVLRKILQLRAAAVQRAPERQDTAGKPIKSRADHSAGKDASRASALDLAKVAAKNNDT